MKLCPTCNQPVADEIIECPACGQDVSARRQTIDDYRIVDVLHEGYSTFLCRAVRERTNEHVMLRLFTPKSGVDAEVAGRLQSEIEKLKHLPGEGFVRHYAIRRSSDGLWYRISEWVDSESWGSLLASGRLNDLDLLLDLFHQTARILSVLHTRGHFIPHLILNDIMAVPDDHGGLRIKIDYKLSRFLNPNVDRPAPMLKGLFAIHPDIVNGRPLDFRSDIWSLGKLFVELIAGDFEVDDPIARIDRLDIPNDLTVLLRVMLADDPDLRPQSMSEIADDLQRIRTNYNTCVVTPSPPIAVQPLPSPTRRWKFSALIAGILLVLIALLWVYRQQSSPDPESALEAAANRYSPSIAFVLVDYGLKVEGKTVYRNVAEGTAFLADREGYLLTSRHVVCPWLKDPGFLTIVQYSRMQKIDLTFNYRICIWFEGTQAFNPSGRMISSPDITDVYAVENAYTSDGARKVAIVGVSRPSTQTRQRVKAPLKDDVAVLKIDSVPPGLTPLPIDSALQAEKLPKLGRVIALGFPLGSRTQEDTVNTSVVRGSIRRAFQSMFQIDASLHGGNSGGPVIDTRGQVIGIVSAVAMDYRQGLVPMAAPVWDFGMILPITEAAQLLNDIKAGQAKWNGVIDFSEEAALAKIRQIAVQGRWAEAMAAADDEVGRSLQPALVTMAALLHFCNGDAQGARYRFLQALSMDPDDYQSRFMLTLIDWLSERASTGSYYRDLQTADWRSPGEFQGFLLKLLEGKIDGESPMDAWTNASEQSWIDYVAGRKRLREGQPAEAETLFESAALAAEPDAWEQLLAKAALDTLRRQHRAVVQSHAERSAYASHVQEFDRQFRENLECKRNRQEQLAKNAAKLADEDVTLDEKIAVLQAGIEVDPAGRSTHGILAYLNASADRFQPGLEHLQAFLGSGARSNSMRMSLGLLEAGIRNYQGQKELAGRLLAQYASNCHDRFFLSVADYLAGKVTEEGLRDQVGNSPENTLIAFANAGFWAEGAKDRGKALRLYREAFGSLLDNWVEFDFVRERLNRLRRQAE